MFLVTNENMGLSLCIFQLTLSIWLGHAHRPRLVGTNEIWTLEWTLGMASGDGKLQCTQNRLTKVGKAFFPSLLKNKILIAKFSKFAWSSVTIITQKLLQVKQLKIKIYFITYLYFLWTCFSMFLILTSQVSV